MHKLNAFENYLLGLPMDQAIQHVLECLRDHTGDLAWNLIKKYNGDEWACEAKDMRHFIAQTLLKLEKDSHE